MAVQWIALALTAVIAVVSIVTGLYQSGQATRSRADLSGMKLQVMELISQQLTDFVRAQSLKDYIEGHAKEHKTLEQELTRLRDWKDKLS